MGVMADMNERTEPTERVEPTGRIGVVVTGRCQGCGACLLTCPEHAIRPSHAVGPEHRSGPDLGTDPGPLSVLGALCTGCGECVEVCPVDAINEFRIGASVRGPANESPNGSENGSSQ